MIGNRGEESEQDPSLGIVSFIVPAYNAAATLQETLDSVLAQTCSGWELIVVDDGSSDDTAKIAGRYAGLDARIRVVTQENAGESSARNTGISHARGEWLVFLDSDDWIGPTYLEKLSAELSAHPELDAVHCGSVRVTLDGTEITDDYEPPAGDMFPVLARRAAFPVHACMVRKSVVEAVGKLDTSLKTCPDWDLWQKIARAGARFGAVREVLAYYRVRPNSSSTHAERLFLDGLTVLKRGHSADPRVPQPLPQYVDGLHDDTVESQVFYLLCWGAGLLLGSGEDARGLLEHAREYRFPELYPDAVAKCILEAGTLPSSEPREAWESLFLTSASHVEDFLEALEAQAEAPGLAAASLQKLKRMILERSPHWKSVLEEQEGKIRELNRDLSTVNNRVDELNAERERIFNTIRLIEEKAALEMQLAAMRQMESQLRKQIDEARDHEAHVRIDLDSALRREASLQLELRDAQQQHAVFEREMEASRALHAAWQQEMQDARDQHRLFEQELADAREQHHLFEQQLADARDQHSMFEQQLAQAQERHTQFQKELYESITTQLSLNTEIEAAQQREIELRQDLENAIERERLLQARQQHAIDTESTLRTRLDESRQEHANLRNQLQEAGEQLRLAGIEKDTLMREVEEIAEELELARTEAAALGIANRGFEAESQWVRTGTWFRLGRTLGLGSPPQTAEDGQRIDFRPPREYSAQPPHDWTWEFVVGSRSAADVYTVPGHPESFRVIPRRAVNQVRWDIQLNRRGLDVRLGHRYTLTFRARADRPRTILVGVAQAHEPWSNVGLSTEVLVTQEWREFRYEFTATVDESNARVHVDLGGRKTAVELSDFQVRDQGGPSKS